MAFNKAKKHLEKYNLDSKIIVLKESSATVKDAALALNCEEKMIAKSLTFKLNDQVIMILAAGDAKIDNSKYKAEFKEKAKMLTPDEVDKLIGHSIGGVCPFGINENVLVYLDESLKRFEIVYPACGTANSAVKLRIEELEQASNYQKWINVCKDWE